MIATTNASGTVVSQAIYDPWGKRTAVYLTSVLANFTYSEPTDRGYTGHKHLKDLDIIHMGGRIYDPTLGRFLQADPNIQAPLDSQSYNRYAYVRNNPMSMTDPSGYFFDSLTKLAGFLGGGIAGAALSHHTHRFIANSQTLTSLTVATVGIVTTAFCGPCSIGFTALATSNLTYYATGSLRASLTAGAVTAIMSYAYPYSYEAFIFTAIDSVNSDVGNVLRFMYYGVDTKSFFNTTINLANEVKNYYVSEELARFAHKNGMTLIELNALLTLNSFLGNKIAGSRYNKDRNEISGFTSRTKGLLGIIWDVNDTILGYQGLLDASGHDYITGSKVGLAISSCHSLGTLTCNNLVARGYAPSAQLNSLPFGNIAVGNNALMTNLGQWDIVNGGLLGRIFNPTSNSTSCLDGGTSGMFCHGWDANYRPIQNGGR